MKVIAYNNKKVRKGVQCSKNFKLRAKIKDLNHFYYVLLHEKSIFWNFKVFPTAFFFSWHIKIIYDGIQKGLFWTINPIKK